MPNFVFVEYDNETGKYLGHSYSPEQIITSENPIRKLTIEETRMAGTELAEFKYNETELVKLPEACFIVSPETYYQIGLHNKICIMLKKDSDTPDNEYQQLLNNEYKVSINGQEFDLKFEEMFFINPTQTGIYTFEMIDPRIYVKKPSYVVTVLEATPQEI